MGANPEGVFASCTSCRQIGAWLHEVADHYERIRRPASHQELRALAYKVENDEIPALHESVVNHNDKDIQHYKQTIAAFQADKERYLAIQSAVDRKQRKLKQEVKRLQRLNSIYQETIKKLRSRLEVFER